MLLCRLLVPLVLALSASAVHAARPAALQGFTDGLQGLDGRFVQRVFDAQGALTEETRGRVSLSAPRQFRWEYEAPFPQLIVADGDHVWVYDPDLEQAQVRLQSHEEQQSPLAALVDPDELERQFVVTEADPADGLQWVLLTPRDADAAQVSAARLGFEGDELRRMNLADALGQRTEIVFEGWSRNPSFAADTFHFTPPEGVDVIGEMAKKAEVFGLDD